MSMRAEWHSSISMNSLIIMCFAKGYWCPSFVVYFSTSTGGSGCLSQPINSAGDTYDSLPSVLIYILDVHILAAIILSW